MLVFKINFCGVHLLFECPGLLPEENLGCAPDCQSYFSNTSSRAKEPNISYCVIFKLRPRDYVAFFRNLEHDFAKTDTFCGVKISLQMLTLVKLPW